jgi:hypothetical protein
MGPTAVFVLVQTDNGVNWNHLKVIQKIPEPHNRKAGNKEIWRRNFTGHCTHTSENTTVEVQNIEHGK